MTRSFKVANIGKECVACGSCVSVCPRNAIHIASGIIAQVNRELCVGCGKCAKICPAAVITITERGSFCEKKEMV